MAISFESDYFYGRWYHSDTNLGSYGKFIFQNLSKDIVPKTSWDTMEAFWKASGRTESLPRHITFFVVKGAVFDSELTDWFSGHDFFGMGPFIGSVLFRARTGQTMTMQLFWQTLDQLCYDIGDTVSFFIVETCKEGRSSTKKKVFCKEGRGGGFEQCSIL
jgi:hypothetical protein